MPRACVGRIALPPTLESDWNRDRLCSREREDSATQGRGITIPVTSVRVMSVFSASVLQAIPSGPVRGCLVHLAGRTVDSCLRMPLQVSPLTR
jgi:hypothetical protein